MLLRHDWPRTLFSINNEIGGVALFTYEVTQNINLTWLNVMVIGSNHTRGDTHIYKIVVFQSVTWSSAGGIKFYLYIYLSFIAYRVSSVRFVPQWRKFKERSVGQYEEYKDIHIFFFYICLILVFIWNWRKYSEIIIVRWVKGVVKYRLPVYLENGSISTRENNFKLNYTKSFIPHTLRHTMHT